MMAFRYAPVAQPRRSPAFNACLVRLAGQMRPNRTVLAGGDNPNVDHFGAIGR